ncbi:TetR/AcrR family transcriptional regulator [Microbacterium arborescens]|uniref:TetR/AcrR family transcriptional regulator n=1 Tax=Microbacterium arborescens TaxID=33883 RepID=UPI003C7942DD
MFSQPEPAGSKRDRTRALIVETALRSFRERGYDATTIRHIAAEAGVSVGTTNYHFASKNELVQEFYLRVQQDHEAAALPRLEQTRDLRERLAIVFHTGLDQLAPTHEHAPEFLTAAVSPRSSINPLSPESDASLAIVEGLFRAAVEGSDHRLPADIAAALPGALVLTHLLLAMYWVYDDTTDQAKTRRLLDRGLGLLGMALPLARLPMLRRPLRELLDLIAEARS